MTRRPLIAAAVFLMFLVSLPGLADDLTGSDDYLCSGTSAVGCADGDDTCFKVALRDINVPRFIEIDLDQKLLRTTKASGLDRTTEIKNVEKQNGLIFLQGVQEERAFSIVIAEVTGDMTFGVVSDGVGAAVFGVCTPLPEDD